MIKIDIACNEMIQIFCLFEVFRPTREYFSQWEKIETSPLPVKAYTSEESSYALGSLCNLTGLPNLPTAYNRYHITALTNDNSYTTDVSKIRY